MELEWQILNTWCRLKRHKNRLANPEYPCNIPISIDRLLAAWVAAQVFSQVVRVSASYSEGRGFNLHTSSFTL